MKTIKSVCTSLAFASLAFGTSAIWADETLTEEVPPQRPGALFEAPAEDAGGTPDEQGVGGSVEVESAGPGAHRTSPYDEVGDFDPEEGVDQPEPSLTDE